MHLKVPGRRRLRAAARLALRGQPPASPGPPASSARPAAQRPRLVAFFAILYYSGLRPEEAINLRKDDVILPPMFGNAGPQRWDEPADDDDWGELHLRAAAPDAGAEWTDDGSHRELRQLKQRAVDDSRTVPVPQRTMVAVSASCTGGRDPGRPGRVHRTT